jgi:hypothetical protein
MKRPFLRVTVTLHKDGTVSVVVEWVARNPGKGYDLQRSPLPGIIVSKIASDNKRIP